MARKGTAPRNAGKSMNITRSGVLNSPTAYSRNVKGRKSGGKR